MTAIDTSTEAVERLLENVTPGPWRIKDCATVGYRCTSYYQEIWNDQTDILVTTEVTRAHNDGGAKNMRFIAAARNLVPALLKERDEARAALAASQPADPVTNAGCRQPVQVKPLEPAPVTLAEAAKVPETDAERFDRADWFWRTMDIEDSGDTPSEAIHRGMVGHFCVCEIASSYTGPTRYGFTAPVLDQDSDDDEFLHFATEQEAIDAAKDRISALRAIGEGEA